MSSVRKAAVAGQFYAGSTAELKREVDNLLDQSATEGPCPKVLVAPHAGYVYSGPIAAAVYGRLRNATHPIERVVLLGPSHRVAFRGIATSSATSFETPLGQVPLDREAIAKVEKLPWVAPGDAAHAGEHSLEVHLPFLQRCLAGFQLVPLVVGDAAPDQVAAAIDSLWGGPETLIVVSSDLSHFLPYEQAREKDAATCRQIEAQDPSLTGDQACGCRPLNGLLTVLKERGLRIERVVAKNSGDTAGSRDRVVGYGAWVVNDGARHAVNSDSTGESNDDATPDNEMLSLAQRQQLLHLARSAIVHGFSRREAFEFDIAAFDSELQTPRGSFVTLNAQGRLRGCIGNLTDSRPLLHDVASNAGAAAFRDPRFAPLRPEEYPGIEVHISVLSRPSAIAIRSRAALAQFLRPGVHGVILQEGSRRATYLPSVWEKLPDPDQFIAELRTKAGLPRSGWSEHTRVSIYTTQEFS